MMYNPKTTETGNPDGVIYVKVIDEKEVRKATIRGFLGGLVIGTVAVACAKDDSETIKELGKTLTTIATSYYGCKFIYSLIS